MELRVDTVELLRQTTAIIPDPGLKNAGETSPLGGFGSVHVILAMKQLPLENQSPGNLRARQSAAVGWSSRATKKSDSWGKGCNCQVEKRPETCNPASWTSRKKLAKS